MEKAINGDRSDESSLLDRSSGDDGPNKSTVSEKTNSCGGGPVKSVLFEKVSGDDGTDKSAQSENGGPVESCNNQRGNPFVISLRAIFQIISCFLYFSKLIVSDVLSLFRLIFQSVRLYF